MMNKTEVTAAALAIGDELLSGRTRDKNIGHLAQTLTSVGITLREVRIVADEESEIVVAVNALREKYDYLFTSGGIGPTHDDITADAISKAFGVDCIYDEDAMNLLSAHYKSREMEFTDARQRMARMPHGSTHIDNPVSKAPGFNKDNVFVMAGVPKVFEAMLNNVVPTLETGQMLLSRSVPCRHGEGVIGTPLGLIQKENPDISIGSYPRFGDDGSFSTEIIVRGLSQTDVDKAAMEIEQMLANLN